MSINLFHMDGFEGEKTDLSKRMDAHILGRELVEQSNRLASIPLEPAFFELSSTGTPNNELVMRRPVAFAQLSNMSNVSGTLIDLDTTARENSININSSPPSIDFSNG